MVFNHTYLEGLQNGLSRNPEIAKCDDVTIFSLWKTRTLLNDEELQLFGEGLERIAKSYWLVPEVVSLPERLANVDGKLKAQIIEIWREISGRGYRSIATLHESFLEAYLLGAIIAKSKFDRPFRGIQSLPGCFSMRPLIRDAWREEDIVCLSGFVSHSSGTNILRYIVRGMNYHKELVWVTDNDLYVCTLPSVIIITRRQDAEIPDIGFPVGIRYTDAWNIETQDGAALEVPEIVRNAPMPERTQTRTRLQALLEEIATET